MGVINLCYTAKKPKWEYFSADGNFIPDADAAYIDVIAIGGGGGAGGGAKSANATSAGGGGGASGGAVVMQRLYKNQLASVEPIIIGVGGAGSPGLTSTGSTGSGVEGGKTFFGGNDISTAKVTANGGRPALGANAGFPLTPNSNNVLNQSGYYIGVAGATGSAGIVSTLGASGASGGGGIDGSGVGYNAGGWTKGCSFLGKYIIGGNNGGKAPDTGDGADGDPAITDGSSVFIYGGPGESGAAGVTVSGGKGGNGSQPGGPGAGGGGAVAAVPSSGAGGDGADGGVYVITYYS